MVSLDQVKRGAAKYIECEIVSKLPGWKKWVFGGCAALVLQNIDSVYDELRSKELVRMMNVITDDGQINIEEVYRHIRSQAEKTGDVPVIVPLIGEMRFSAADIDVLYQKIMEG